MSAPHPAVLLAAQIEAARRGNQPITLIDPTWMPADAQAAGQVQGALIALRGGAIGGWKVGAKTPGGPAQGAPLPADSVLASGATLPLAQRRLIGLELEIAFRFSRSFAPRAEPYGDEDILTAIGAVMATIELVSSRFADAGTLDRRLQLADLQNHGALVVGAAVPYPSRLDFSRPALRWRYRDHDILPAQTGNPAGDPRSLLPWLVNHASARGVAITPQTVITTGTFTGVYLPTAPGLIVGQVADLPEVRLQLA